MEEVVKKYGNMIRRVAALNTSSLQDAEDVYQEVFVDLMRYQDRIEDEEHLKAWLLRVTMNKCHSQARMAFRHYEIPMEDATVLNHGTEDFKETLEHDEIYRKVMRLPEKYREVVLLHYYEELSVKEIAEILDINENTVKTRLARARMRLAVLLAILVLAIAAAIVLGRYFWQSLRPVSQEEISHAYSTEELAEAIHILIPVRQQDELIVDLPAGSDSAIEKGMVSVWRCVDIESGSYVLVLNSKDTEKRIIESEDSKIDRHVMYAETPIRKFIITDSSGHESECTAVEKERGEDYAIYDITLFIEDIKIGFYDSYMVTMRVRTDSDYEQAEILGYYLDSEGGVPSDEEYQFVEGTYVSPFAFMRAIAYDEEGNILPFDEWEGESSAYKGFVLSGELGVRLETMTEDEDLRYVFSLYDTEGNSYWTDMSK